MSRFVPQPITSNSTKSPRLGGSEPVARLFVPGFERGFTVKVRLRGGRNSDARRRLARVFESRRTVS
jgi:hypothetical protein